MIKFLFKFLIVILHKFFYFIHSLFKTQKHTSFYITDFHQINNLSEIIKNILIKNKRKNNKLHKINLTFSQKTNIQV